MANIGTIEPIGNLPGIGISITVTTPGGAPTTLEFPGLIDCQLPARENNTANWTPMNGPDRAYYQQVAIGSQKAAKIMLTVVYDPDNAADIDNTSGIDGCEIAATLTDGSIYSGMGGISRAATQKLQVDQVMLMDIVIEFNAGWLLTAPIPT